MRVTIDFITGLSETPKGDDLFAKELEEAYSAADSLGGTLDQCWRKL